MDDIKELLMKIKADDKNRDNLIKEFQK